MKTMLTVCTAILALIFAPTAPAAEATFVSDNVTIAYTSATAVAAGDVVAINGSNLLAIARNAIPVGSLGVLYTRGVYDVSKDTSGSTAIGTKWYWQIAGNAYGTTTGTGCATTNYTAGPYIGWCTAVTVATNDATVRLVLNGREPALPGWPTADPGVIGAVWSSNGAVRVSQ